MSYVPWATHHDWSYTKSLYTDHLKGERSDSYTLPEVTYCPFLKFSARVIHRHFVGFSYTQIVVCLKNLSQMKILGPCLPTFSVLWSGVNSAFLMSPPSGSGAIHPQTTLRINTGIKKVEAESTGKNVARTTGAGKLCVRHHRSDKCRESLVLRGLVSTPGLCTALSNRESNQRLFFTDFAMSSNTATLMPSVVILITRLSMIVMG